MPQWSSKTAMPLTKSTNTVDNGSDTWPIRLVIWSSQRTQRHLINTNCGPKQTQEEIARKSRLNIMIESYGKTQTESISIA